MGAVLEGRGLVKRYGTGVVAVDGVDLRLGEGEVLGLLGPNGAGKTTLIRMLVGQLAPSAGTIELAGSPLARSAVARLVGTCPQQVTIWDRLTCHENIVLLATLSGMRRRDAAVRADALLEELQLSGKRDAQASTLSGGMKRRLNLAMAIAHEPKVAILDEPSPGLDPQTRALLWDFIASLPGRGHSVLLTTHFMDEAEVLSDRVMIIDQGVAIAEGSPTELVAALGDGDVVTVHVGEAGVAVEALGDGWGEVLATDDHVVRLRGLDLVPRMPELLAVLEGVDQRPTKVSMRNNTLEDVFLSLTGRSLRGEGDATEPLATVTE